MSFIIRWYDNDKNTHVHTVLQDEQLARMETTRLLNEGMIVESLKEERIIALKDLFPEPKEPK